MTETAEKFEQWCILEIMGHQTYAGKVSEQTLGGASFVRIDIPETKAAPAFSKLFGAGSIYCITPVSEQVARMRAENLQQTPLSIYDLPEAVRERLRTPALTGPHNDDEDEEFDDEFTQEN
jgi:hypothetical protein